jgi:hypothetical protein
MRFSPSSHRLFCLSILKRPAPGGGGAAGASLRKVILLQKSPNRTESRGTCSHRFHVRTGKLKSKDEAQKRGQKKRHKIGGDCAEART